MRTIQSELTYYLRRNVSQLAGRTLSSKTTCDYSIKTIAEDPLCVELKIFTIEDNPQTSQMTIKVVKQSGYTYHCEVSETDTKGIEAKKSVDISLPRTFAEMSYEYKSICNRMLKERENWLKPNIPDRERRESDKLYDRLRDERLNLAEDMRKTYGETEEVKAATPHYDNDLQAWL